MLGKSLQLLVLEEACFPTSSYPEVPLLSFVLETNCGTSNHKWLFHTLGIVLPTTPALFSRTAQEVGLCEPHEVQQGQVQGSAPGSEQTPLSQPLKFRPFQPKAFYDSLSLFPTNLIESCTTQENIALSKFKCNCLASLL